MTHLLKAEANNIISTKCGATFTRPTTRKDRPTPPSPFDDGRVTGYSGEVTCERCRG